MTMVRVLLAGGPESLTGEQCFQEVADLAEKVKIESNQGYEHFTNSGQIASVDGENYPVFEWCDHTRIAE